MSRDSDTTPSAPEDPDSASKKPEAECSPKIGAREGRLSDALRENLRRRKARGRAAETGSSVEAQSINDKDVKDS